VVALDLNIDGTQMLQVRREEMIAFLPDVIPAIQEVTALPLCFDNPAYEFHKTAFEYYDRSKGGQPIMNSVAASRENLDKFFELIIEYGPWVIVMASERFAEFGSAQCLTPEEAYNSAKEFVGLLRDKAGRTNNQIIIDPDLAPVGADTYGLVNMGLDAMRMIRQDPDLEGVHMSVGLTNFAWGTPKDVRHQME